MLVKAVDTVWSLKEEFTIYHLERMWTVKAMPSDLSITIEETNEPLID